MSTDEMGTGTSKSEGAGQPEWNIAGTAEDAKKWLIKHMSDPHEARYLAGELVPCNIWRVFTFISHKSLDVFS